MQDEHSARCIFAQMPAISIWAAVQLSRSSSIHGLCLKDEGFVEGENVAVEYRWADNQINRVSAMAAELVRRQVGVIVAAGGNAAPDAAKAATTTIPILFITPDDPVKLDFVTNLARPSGNLTGITFLGSELGCPCSKLRNTTSSSDEDESLNSFRPDHQGRPFLGRRLCSRSVHSKANPDFRTFFFWREAQ
jgi:ABC transporter substrate binding protein